jgi:two-component system, NarL family, response regulator
MKKNSIRILLVDDHYVVRVGLIGILNLEPDLEIVADAENGAQAIELFRQHRPDVTLMDIRMPRLNGVATTVEIRKEFPEARMIMLTTYDGDEDIHRALRIGARGYLLKNIPGDELIRAIRMVHAGQQYLPTEIARRVAERAPDCDLTPRELEVLHLMAKGLSNREIGEILGFTENTSKAHIKNILSKLDVSDRTEAATRAIERGILHFD